MCDDASSGKEDPDRLSESELYDRRQCWQYKSAAHPFPISYIVRKIDLLPLLSHSASLSWFLAAFLRAAVPPHFGSSYPTAAASCRGFWVPWQKWLAGCFRDENSLHFCSAGPCAWFLLPLVAPMIQQQSLPAPKLFTAMALEASKAET